jgi:hypothetical protein
MKQAGWMGYWTKGPYDIRETVPYRRALPGAICYFLHMSRLPPGDRIDILVERVLIPLAVCVTVIGLVIVAVRVIGG